MPALLRRSPKCFYCGQKSRNQRSGKIRSFQCHNCDAVNYLDERGEITDPPVEAQDNTWNVRYAQPVPRPVSPELATPSDQLFCSTCLKNQYMFTQALSEYLPPPSDPEYFKYEASVDEYKQSLERRYPQVCADCLPRVRSRIRAAGYAAKTDHLRRVLDRTRGGALEDKPWGWRNGLVFVAMQLYYSSILLQGIWHLSGALMRPEGLGDANVSCISQAVWERSLEPRCFDELWEFARVGIVCGLMSFWWNPRLKDKASGSGGRLRGLEQHLFLQAIILAVRTFSLWYLHSVSPTQRDALSFFKAQHAFMLVFLALTTPISLRIVYIDHTPLFSFAQTIEPNLPSPTRNEVRKPNTLQPIRSSFDTMAESFSENFPIGKLIDSSSKSVFPPSPTETSLSSNSPGDTESRTTVSDYANTLNDDNSMDWTPTRPISSPSIFARNNPVPISSFLQPRQPPQTTPAPIRQPHSLLSDPNANPFRGPLPAAPKPPAHKLNNPFPVPLVKQASAAEKKDFFKRMMVSNGSPSSANELVPKSGVAGEKPQGPFVLEQGKMIWKEEEKVTGLEGMFDSFFSVDADEDAVGEGEVTPKAVKKGNFTPSKIGDAGGREQAPGYLKMVGQMLLFAAVPVVIGAVILIWKNWDEVDEY